MRCAETLGAQVGAREVKAPLFFLFLVLTLLQVPDQPGGLTQ